MKQPIVKTTGAPDSYMLSALVAKLIFVYKKVAIRQNSFFINNVRGKIYLQADEKIFTKLLGSALYVMMRCSKDTYIRISAKKYNDIILLHIKDRNTFNSYAILSKRQYLQKLARMIGGHLDITSVRRKETTISFSFPNKKNTRLAVDNYHLLNHFE